MHRISHLIRELDRIARERRWSSADLAHELGMDRTLLFHLRAGRRSLTLPILSRIAERFGGVPLIRDLLYVHLAVEIPEEQTSVAPVSLTIEELKERGIAEGAARMLRDYVRTFATECVFGRGLAITAREPATLTAAVAFIRDELALRRIPIFTVPANRKLAPADRRTARAAPLVIVERLDFLGDAVADLLRERDELARSVVVTRLAGATPTTRPDVAHVLPTTIRLVDLDPPSSPSPHGSLPVSDAARASTS